MIEAVKRRRLADVFLRTVGEPRRLALLLGSLFALFAARAATLPVDDPDVWWIAAAGRDLLSTWQIPVRNAYSFTAPNTPWIMHELAFGILYACGLRALGPSFFPLLTIVVAAASVAVAAAAIAARASRPASAGIALLLLVVGCREGLFQPRPSHTAIVLPLLMAAIALRPGWSTLRTLAVVVLEIVWTNAHGSFPLGIAIVGAASFDDRETRTERLVAASLAAVATLANPYGIRLHGLVRGYALGGDPASRVIHEHVVEFFPVWKAWWSLNPLNAAALLTVTMLAIRALLDGRNLSRALLSLALVALAAYQVRHVVLAVALGALLLHAEIDDLFAAEGLAAGALPRWLAPAIVLPGLLLGVVAWGSARATRDGADWIAPATGGASLARLAANLPVAIRAYVPFESGGLAIWFGGERGVRVFFDSRNDCYPPDVAEEGFGLERGQSPEWVERVLESRGADVALVSAQHPVYTALVRSETWKMARSDGRWAEFRR